MPVAFFTASSPCPALPDYFQIRLRFTRRWQFPPRGEVALRAGDQQFFRWETGDDFAAIFRHYDFFFKPRGGPTVGGGPIGFQPEDHAFFDHFGMIE